jgi:hypothetical protein
MSLGFDARDQVSQLTSNTHREMQLFLLGYLIIEICEIFTIGGFPLNGAVRKVCHTLCIMYVLFGICTLT